MKKIFTLLFMIFCLSVLGFTQSRFPLPGPEVLVQEMLKLIPQPKITNTIYFFEKDVEGSFSTQEENRLFMTEDEYLKFYGRKPILEAPETKTTTHYKQAIINIPADCALYDVTVGINKKTGEPYLYLFKDTISMEINNKELSFKLDYEINLTNEADKKEFLKLGKNFSLYNKPLKISINYDQNYFTLEQVKDYDTEKQVNVIFNNQEITLNTITKPILYLEDKERNIIEFVLVPNFQNLYQDFTFVREGHKDAEFIDVK